MDIIYEYADIRKVDVPTNKLGARHVRRHYLVKILSLVDDSEKQSPEELVRRYAYLAMEALETSGSKTEAL